ncbi:hypothetical protein FGIG_01639 [Fasciola gigantica]|uniref:Uncharacterized protein n=1 Tax=Fasciola gigantica TaxID=46835 RepID=A0A504YTA0_FASGI|nr:hypothetical protein FGIG_01639 [Fasciola gigantica]
MDTQSSLQNSLTSKDDCFTQKSLFPITSAIAWGKDSLLVGISSVLGNYWTGGLGIYKWDKQSDTVFGGLCETTEYGIVEDLSPRLHSFATFEASVAAITVLHRGSSSEDEVSVVGLDDGSLQIITKPPGDHDNSKQPLTIDSATYHDWPIERVLSEHDCLISLDSAGVFKTWDLERFTPTVSWAIGSSPWPRGGQALETDAALCPAGSDTSSPSYMVASLSPCDPDRQMAVWDVRLASVRHPPLLCSPVLSTNRCKDLPRSLAWLTPNLLLVGTIEGQLHAVDIRHITNANPVASVKDRNRGIVASVDTSSWFSQTKSPDSSGENQILQIILTECSPSTRLLGLIGQHGSLSICELKSSSSTGVLPSHPLYHTQACNVSELSPHTAVGLRRAGGLFLPVLTQSHPSAPDTCTHWHAITYSGLPELNADRYLGPLVYSGLPRVHTGPWGGPWGKHRATCPLAQTDGKTPCCTPYYYIRSCSDPVWSIIEGSSGAGLDSHMDTSQAVQTTCSMGGDNTIV